MTRMEHFGDANGRFTRKHGRKKAPHYHEFRESFEGAMEKTRAKWKAKLREELEVTEALNMLGQIRE